MTAYREVHEYIGEFIEDLQELEESIEANGATGTTLDRLADLTEKWEDFGPELEKLLLE